MSATKPPSSGTERAMLEATDAGIRLWRALWFDPPLA
jgi:hypothetical protein